MTIAVLSLVVLAQIALFQFVSAIANRSLILQELRSLDDPAPARLAEHSRRAPIVRMVLGTVLGCLALLPLTGLIIGPGLGKLLLVVLSITSAIAFAYANARDRKMMRLLVDHLPGGGVRRASLEPRSLRQWYHPALEAIPIALFVATFLFLVGNPEFIMTGQASANTDLSGDRLHALLLFGLQGLIVFGGLYHSLRKGVDVESMATHIPSLRKRPEVALRLGERLAGTQVRYFMFAKIGVALLLGAKVVEKVFEATGNPSASFWDAIGWGLLAVFLVGFFFYLRKVGTLSRRMQQEMDLANNNVASSD